MVCVFSGTLVTQNLVGTHNCSPVVSYLCTHMLLVERINQLNDRWSCYICSPQPIEDLIVKNGWDLIFTKQPLQTAVVDKYCIYSDVSVGRERFRIPVYNEVDGEGPPLNFVYTPKVCFVLSLGIDDFTCSIILQFVSSLPCLPTNPSYITCCSCTDGCDDATKCECLRSMGGAAYNSDGVAIVDKAGGIYEYAFV